MRSTDDVRYARGVWGWRSHPHTPLAYLTLTMLMSSEVHLNLLGRTGAGIAARREADRRDVRGRVPGAVDNLDVPLSGAHAVTDDPVPVAVMAVVIFAPGDVNVTPVV